MLRNFLSYADVLENRRKKALFLFIGLISLTIGVIILKFLKIENAAMRKLLSAAVVCMSMYFIAPIVFLSYIKPIYSFKYGIVNVILGFILIWPSFIIFIYFDKAIVLTFVSIVISFFGMMISGMIINTNFMVLIYVNGILNYTFSRIFLILYAAELYLELLNKIL